MILPINDLALELVARDFSDGHAAPGKVDNIGPTKTSRALAIIHLAAHDAFAQVANPGFSPILANLPPLPAGLAQTAANGEAAMVAAAVRASLSLYPSFNDFINGTAKKLLDGSDPRAVVYGERVADAWLKERSTDGSGGPQLDQLYDSRPGRHRPDPSTPNQLALGRTWGLVRPFALSSVEGDAPLGPPPALDSLEYGQAYDQVFECGSDDITSRSADFRHKGAIGIFWAYDGANKIGVPPRLYNQFVRAIPEFASANMVRQFRILTAINVAMADAGIAAWYWKYYYDFWRPVVGIREADQGWGPTGAGDQNPHRQQAGDPFWLPLGAPKSNPFPGPAFGVEGANFTPNFPAYPSGHSTFGTAAFLTAARMLDRRPEDLNVEFVSDELNGVTADHTGAIRPKFIGRYTLADAILDNQVSRIYLGVHWCFDATGGETVGRAVADKIAELFS